MLPRLQNTAAISIIPFEEPIMPELTDSWSYDSERNKYIRSVNRALANIIPRTGIDNKIFTLSITRKTVVNQNGIYMMPDRRHIIDKNHEVRIPPAMKANLNILLNFLCNAVIKPSSSACCL